MPITHERLRELVHYDPETGVFTWLVRIANAVKVGDMVGSLNSRGYRCFKLGSSTSFKAHRVAWFYMTGEWPDQIDHIDGCRSNNAWANLRNVNKAENSKNKRKYKNNKSGHTGVYWGNTKQRWCATIRTKTSRVTKSFKSKDDALAARDALEANLGFHPNHGRSV